MNRKSGSDLFRVIRAFLLWCVLGGLPASALAQAPPQIPGTPPTQVTTKAQDQEGPSISGNIVCYTNYLNNGEVHCYDLATKIDVQVTTANLATGTYQVAGDVSGNTVVYTEYNSAGTTAYDCVGVSETTSPPCTPVALGTSNSFSPAIDGSLVAWIDGIETWAVDLSTSGTPTQLTNNGNNSNQRSLAPNVSGRNIAYSTLNTGTALCDVFVTNFDSRTTTQLTNGASGCNNLPDIYGNYVVYQSTRNSQPGCSPPPISPTATNCSQIFVYDLNAKQETAVPTTGLGAVQQNPHISGDWVSFEDVTCTSTACISSLRLYRISTGEVYTAVQANTQLQSAFLNDIDGNNLVYTSAAAGNYDIYLFQFTPPGIDFSLGAIPPITVSTGESVFSTVTVNANAGFSSPVTLSTSGLPIGASASFAPNPVTPLGGGSIPSTMILSVSPAATPSTFVMTVTGTSGTQAHSTNVSVTVTVTTSSLTDVIGQLLGAGCIDNSGIASALTSKLAAAQAAINAGNLQAAINILTAFIHQVQAQAGKHIALSCGVNGITLNSDAVLISDAQALIDSTRVSAIPNPITGYVLNPSGLGVFGASVTIVDAGSNPVATATTDVTGFYFFATTGVLATGSSYTVTASAAGFTVSAPPSQSFTWQAAQMNLVDFVLN